MDTTDLDSAPQTVKFAHGKPNTRVYLVTTYEDGSQWHRTGRIGMTTGTKPAYLLMSSTSAIGSSGLLTAETWKNTVVAGIQNGPGWGYYTPGNQRQNIPGVTYRDEPSRYGGTDFRVMPGRNRHTSPTNED